MSDKLDWSNLEETIGYSFHDKTLARHAMTHSSYANESHLPKENNNERLEFLGDAVLELVSSDYLYHERPNEPEGVLTKKRASMVCEPALAFCAREISLEKFLLLGKGEEQTGGRTRDSITSDALEALIGAIYLDGGFEPAKAFIEKFILTDVEDKQLFYDSKTVLQEMVQAEGARTLQYIPAGEEGPDHNKTFTAKAALDGSVISVGRGKTKKAAEQDAAYQAILKLRERK